MLKVGKLILYKRPFYSVSKMVILSVKCAWNIEILFADPQAQKFRFHTFFLDYSSSKVSFSSCQQNLIKTFQIEARIALITKMALIFLETCYMAKNRRQKVPKPDFQSQISTSKILQIFQKKIFVEKYQFRSTFFVFINFV